MNDRIFGKMQIKYTTYSADEYKVSVMNGAGNKKVWSGQKKSDLV